MYNNDVMCAVRQSLGLDDPYDTSLDEQIKAMPRNEVFEKCLNWENIVGYSEQIIAYISSIYNVDLEPRLDKEMEMEV